MPLPSNIRTSYLSMVFASRPSLAGHSQGRSARLGRPTSPGKLQGLARRCRDLLGGFRLIAELRHLGELIERHQSLPGLAIDDPGTEWLHPRLPAEVGPGIDALRGAIHIR